MMIMMMIMMMILSCTGSGLVNTSVSQVTTVYMTELVTFGHSAWSYLVVWSLLFFYDLQEEGAVSSELI